MPGPRSSAARLPPACGCMCSASGDRCLPMLFDFHHLRHKSQIKGKGQARKSAVRPRELGASCAAFRQALERRRKTSIIAKPPSPSNATLAGSGTVMTVKPGSLSKSMLTLPTTPFPSRMPLAIKSFTWAVASPTTTNLPPAISMSRVASVDNVLPHTPAVGVPVRRPLRAVTVPP